MLVMLLHNISMKTSIPHNIHSRHIVLLDDHTTQDISKTSISNIILPSIQVSNRRYQLIFPLFDCISSPLPSTKRQIPKIYNKTLLLSNFSLNQLYNMPVDVSLLILYTKCIPSIHKTVYKSPLFIIS